MKLLQKRGQSIGEYAILLGIVLGAVFAVQNYIRNRIAGGVQATATYYFDGSTMASDEKITSLSSSVSQSDMGSHIGSPYRRSTTGI
ncbi:MAG: hypothetical protein IH804_02825 [Planctomycetes bacterium]|nr:hypothetical protein [Planctomycetota bacterium]